MTTPTRSFASCPYGLTDPWVLILAGGDGTRLRSLTSQLTGDARPKQFCALARGETMLDATRRRAALLARDDRHVVVVSRPHEEYYRYLERDLAPGRLVVQPRNRDTGPGILYPLLRVAALAGDVPIAIFPSDHYVSDDAAFAAHVRTALAACVTRRYLVVLLGVEPSSPERDYGWIETGTPPPGDTGPVERVRCFREKPSATEATALMRSGGLWNTFVMAGCISSFLRLIASSAPTLMHAFTPVRLAIDSPRETAAIARLYARLPASSFASSILANSPDRLGVIRVKDVDWSDWGTPERVHETLRRTGSVPDWLRHTTLPIGHDARSA